MSDKLHRAMALLQEHAADLGAPPNTVVAERVFASFAPRERQVAALLIRVGTVDPRYIAATMGIAANTVCKNYIPRLCVKTGMGGRTELAVWLLRTPGMAELLDEVKI